MKRYFSCYAMSLLLLIYLPGCALLSKEEENFDLPSKPDTGAEQPAVPPKDVYTSADGYFELSGRDGVLTSFNIDNGNADIRDLALFSATLYRRELSAKLRSGERLSKRELQLLYFCFYAQISALRAFTDTAKQDMFESTSLSDDSDSDAGQGQRDGENFERQVQNALNALKIKFPRSNSTLRLKIAQWCEQFHPIDDKVLGHDLRRIMHGGRQILDEFQFRKIWLYIPGPDIITVPTMQKDLLENKALRPYKVYNTDPHETARQWKALNSALAHHINDLRVIHEDMGLYLSRAVDARSRASVDDFRLSIDSELRSTIMLHAYIFNDLPYAVFCKRAFIGIQNCQNAWFDEEEKMEVVVTDFVLRTRGADILSQIRSPYTADLYVQLLTFVKEQLGGKRYKNYVTKTKLYELDELSQNYFDKNKLK